MMIQDMLHKAIQEQDEIRKEMEELNDQWRDEFEKNQNYRDDELEAKVIELSEKYKKLGRFIASTVKKL